MSIEEQIARKAALECIGKTGSEKEAIILEAIKRAVAIEREIVKQDDRNSNK